LLKVHAQKIKAEEIDIGRVDAQAAQHADNLTAMQGGMVD
jgi:hypothetical protein